MFSWRYFNFFGAEVRRSNVIFSKSIKGYLIRLIEMQGRFFVNLFHPNGYFKSFRFSSVLPAYAFLSKLISSIKSK